MRIVKRCISSPIFFAMIKKLVLLSYQRQPWSLRRVGVVQLVSWLIQGTLTKVSGGVGWLAGISILDQLARSKYFHGSLQEDFGDFLKNKTFVLQGGIPSLRTNRATHLPKGPYWEKYISEFSIVGSYKACWPKREPGEGWMTLWACGPVVSCLCACYIAKRITLKESS